VTLNDSSTDWFDEVVDAIPNSPRKTGKLNAMTSKLKSLSKVVLVHFLFFGTIFWGAGNAAFAASPVAVLKSQRNIAIYNDQHLGNWDEDYETFSKALGAANIRFEEVSEPDITLGQQRTGNYKIIIVPSLVDLPLPVVNSLIEYQKNGGKVLILDAGGQPQAGAQRLEATAGVVVERQETTTDKRKISVVRGTNPLHDEFSIGTVYAVVKLLDGGLPSANWLDKSGNNVGVAAAHKGNAAFISWDPGEQGEVTTNASILGQMIEDLSPGVSQQAAVQISFAEYQTINLELDYLIKRTDESIKTAKQADLTVPFKQIQQRYDEAVDCVNHFHECYKARNFFLADDYLDKARQNFSLAFALAMPVRPVEARSVWLDRGTIISTRTPEGMAQLFDRLKGAGVNVVYFETNNAGFVMFPSKIATQNPQTSGWDPLGAALKEAHKRGMELHAWFWTFNVGNAKHNPLVGKPADYPGPVLSSHDFSWALESADGSLLPPHQFEYWIDPSSPEGRAYIKSLISEVIQAYKVDGIQLDYIRYPFNGKGTEMGFNWSGRMRFEHDTGLSLDKLDDETRKVWQAWKIQQVSSFVHEVSQMVRSQHPGMRISCAVYALPKNWRLSAIEQEWETWVANGWVDTLNPMTYVPDAKQLTTMAGYVRESTNDKALVYPGLSIRQLDTAGLIEQMDSARLTGTLGTTMFAVAQLDDKKINLLKSGPYRKTCTMTPQSEPTKATRLLIDDFANMVNRYLQDPTKRILSDQASTNDVLNQLNQLQHNVKQLNSKSSAEQIDSVNKDVITLHETVKNWLRLEAFIQRGFRAQYIVNYLGQVEAILAYASHKAHTMNDGMPVAGVSLGH
jgi:uncharacterized lipoprotein YddW (UPF0748 family)